MAQDANVSEDPFTSLVIMLSTSAWISLGKIADPASGEVQKDLHSAKLSIDTLIMLREKTSGNLDEDEKKLLDVMIGELQGNYAETVLHPEGDVGAEKQTGEDGSDTEQQAPSKKDAENNEEV